jgi:hypothetical protein
MSPVQCGADTLVRETPVARANRAGASAIGAAIIRSLTVIVAVLREIFDESAYRRFLDRNQMESSTHAYAIFRNENEQSKSRRPRCC